MSAIHQQQQPLKNKYILVTGAAHRLGAEIVTAFHHAGATVAIHYRSSKDATDYLLNDLNSKRADSAFAFQADLQNVDETTAMVKAVLAKFNGQLDVLVNNASTFYSTPFGTITTEQYDDLMGSNFRAPLFLTQACAPALKKSNGNIINMVDINSSTPLENFPVYCAAKAALTMLTKCSAIDLAPHVRCNSISPGIILWPSGVEISPQAKLNLLDKCPLDRKGETSDIVGAALYLATAPYVTGQDIAVAGGAQLGWQKKNHHVAAPTIPLLAQNESERAVLPILKPGDE